MRASGYAWLCILALTPCIGNGDGQTELAQRKLKQEGFFFGEVDGEPGPDTTSAVQRYQIRNGLPVTGALTPETLASIQTGKSKKAAQPASYHSPSVPRVSSPPQKSVPPVPSADRRLPSGDRVIPPEREEKDQPARPPARPVSAKVSYTSLFARTPFENAPEGVQAETLKRAQLVLFRSGFYKDPLDGVASPSTTRALIAYQTRFDLNRTGRMDMDTLAAMRLLPSSDVYAPRWPTVPDNPVVRAPLRGIWIQ